MADDVHNKKCAVTLVIAQHGYILTYIHYQSALGAVQINDVQTSYFSYFGMYYNYTCST